MVGDNGDLCGSIACVDGASGECIGAEGPWAHRRVACAIKPCERVAELNRRWVNGKPSAFLAEAGVLMRVAEFWEPKPGSPVSDRFSMTIANAMHPDICARALPRSNLCEAAAPCS